MRECICISQVNDSAVWLVWFEEHAVRAFCWWRPFSNNAIVFLPLSGLFVLDAQVAGSYSFQWSMVVEEVEVSTCVISEFNFYPTAIFVFHVNCDRSERNNIINFILTDTYKIRI